jgi:hypothetical protein
MEATCSPETPDDFQRTTQHCIPEDRTLHNHRYENLECYKREHASKEGILFEAMCIIHIYDCFITVKRRTFTLGYRNDSSFVVIFRAAKWVIRQREKRMYTIPAFR